MNLLLNITINIKRDLKYLVFVTKKPKVLTFLFDTFVLSSSLDLLVSIFDATNNQIITNKTTKTANLINTVLLNKHKRDNGGRWQQRVYGWCKYRLNDYLRSLPKMTNIWNLVEDILFLFTCHRHAWKLKILHARCGACTCAVYRIL